MFIDTLRTSNHAFDLCERHCNCCQSNLRSNLIQERFQEDVQNQEFEKDKKNS